jgi:outer membrane protein TolC
MRSWLAVEQLACALFLCLSFWPRGARADAPLTIDAAVKLALANNERAQKAPLRVAAALGQLDRARAAFLPTVVANAAGTLSGAPDRNGRIVAGVGTISLNQPLLNIPAIPLYAQARRQVESERWGATQDLRLLAYDTARAFLVVLTSERLLEAANGRLDRARADQQNAEARAAAQLASSNDATRARIETAAARASSTCASSEKPSTSHPSVRWWCAG